ncbi:quercetin 2,3-dioxygenase anaerobically complexed with the substrate kaempferol [Xylariaceae sp. FL0804]|nr:quercetin 2,3-dioxygenase anaerobically complexed with the substrate kaempferol [Xylariaceae sp. FL0804]
MVSASLISGLVLLLPAYAVASSNPLWVDEAPDHMRAYAIQHYKNSHAVTVDDQLFRFMVTGPSSDYAFSLLATNAPKSSALGVLPHIHQEHYENFFNYKGSFQLWAQKGDGEQQARALGPGDYGSVVRNTTHTFQITDPDTEMLGVIVPGGFEDLFYAIGENFTSGTNTAYVPKKINGTSSVDPSLISSLEAFDVYAQLDFVPTRDLVNGSSPSDGSSVWHTGANALGAAGEPYFVANGYGPKYLNAQHGYYQIVQPLVTPEQAQDLAYSLSTISINTAAANATVPTYRLDGAAAFEVLEGRLSIQIGQYETAELISGDVAFIPPQVAFRYWSEVALTKTLFVGAGNSSVDTRLIEGGRSWDWVVFPTQ